MDGYYTVPRDKIFSCQRKLNYLKSLKSNIIFLVFLGYLQGLREQDINRTYIKISEDVQEYHLNAKKQPFIGVLIKRCSENI